MFFVYDTLTTDFTRQLTLFLTKMQIYNKIVITQIKQNKMTIENDYQCFYNL
jgi:hypothetical protein